MAVWRTVFALFFPPHSFFALLLSLIFFLAVHNIQRLSIWRLFSHTCESNDVPLTETKMAFSDCCFTLVNCIFHFIETKTVKTTIDSNKVFISEYFPCWDQMRTFSSNLINDNSNWFGYLQGKLPLLRYL